MTKLCPHIIGWNNDVLDFIGRTQPRIVKVVAPFGHDDMKVAEAKRRSPNSKWLLRFYLNQQPLDKPIYRAQWLAEKCKRYIDDYDIFEDYNEIDPRDHSFDPPKPLKVDTIKRYNEFSAEFGRIIHSWGKGHVTGCWSNGQPPDEAWDHMEECVEFADYVSLHGYGWPTMSECPQFTLRYRRIWQQLLPSNRPLILSEVGMTYAVIGGPDVGWQKWAYPVALQKKEDRAAAEWAWFLDRIHEDPFVSSAHPYTTGRLQGDNWGTHDFTKRLYKLVGDYILGHPSPPWKEEPVMNNPIKVGIRENYKDHKSRIVRVEPMEMEEYLRHCVPYEVYASWNPEALKAQAVAARTYATWMKEHGAHEGFDVCNSACCQVMGPNTDPRTDKAVKDTEGVIITYNGEPIKAKYFSYCGGETQDGDLPYLVSRPCWCFQIAPEGTAKARHNHGMCQWGAEQMARKGIPHVDILHWYYTGVTIDGKTAPSPVDYRQKTLDEIATAQLHLDRAREAVEKIGG